MAAGTAAGEQREDRMRVTGLADMPAPGAGRCGGRARVGNDWRATLARMPAPTIENTSDEPPADRNGSVMPGHRQHADDRAEVDGGLADDPRR